MNDIVGIGAKTPRGYNMQTASGRAFWPTHPRMDEVRITDIAAHLSRICRYNGALKDGVEHYSVAQHSVLVSEHLPPELALEGLLHDAHEAYVGDVIRPIKVELGDTFHDIETVVDQAIRKKYRLPEEMTPAVKEADLIAAVTEKRDLLAYSNGVDWGELPRPWSKTIIACDQRMARELFLKRFVELV